MSRVSWCKLVSLALIIVAIIVNNHGSMALPTPVGDDKLENKSLASFTKRVDGSDLMAVASTSIASASASSQDDKEQDAGLKLDSLPKKKPINSSINEEDRPSSGRDRDLAAIDRVESKKDQRDDEDYDDDRRDRQTGRGRGRGRGHYNDNRDRLDEDDEESTNLDRDDDRNNRGYRHYDRRDRCRRCNEDYDDRRYTNPLDSFLEPMFDMMRRMPRLPSDGVSAVSSASSSFGDGLMRSSGTTIHNGRVKGFLSETGRDGRTRTKYIGDEDD